MKPKLWTRNFCLVTLASIMGSAGAIAGGFALSFLVFDETGSTLASALVLAVRLIPYVLIPLLAAPLMDRLPRKAFLVGGDVCNGLLYAGMGAWLLFGEFSYVGYLALSVVMTCLGAVDSLAFTSIYPELIPEGAEEKGYAVASMLYPVLNVIMAPLAAVLLDVLGVPALLMIQGVLCVAAALTESLIRLEERNRKQEESYTLSAWAGDIREAFAYLKKEKGLRSLFAYMAATNGIGQGYAPILVAFFRTAPGFTAAMYSLFSVAEFAGRSLGSMVQYRIKLPVKKRFGFTFFVYQVYEAMDMMLLWLPYPLMLVNRGLCGFLGSNSAIVREASVQRYIPSGLRSRINAYNEAMITAAGSAITLLVGLLGEVVDYRQCMTVCGIAAALCCWTIIWRNRKDVRKVYEASADSGKEAENAQV